tara:strand:- start:484 stop:786 length:303 start_codon:yes stop_codon:yes gene_type:complete
MSDKLIDISICIGNSYDLKNIIPGNKYNFRVYRDTSVSELKRIFLDCFSDESENTKSILNRYEIYTKKIIRLYDNNIVGDALAESIDSINDENIFYALLI